MVHFRSSDVVGGIGGHNVPVHVVLVALLPRAGGPGFEVAVDANGADAGNHGNVVQVDHSAGVAVLLVSSGISVDTNLTQIIKKQYAMYKL